MRSPLPRCTPDQQARQDAARALGCLACWLNVQLGDFQPTGMWVEVHHHLSGGHRYSQDATEPLCAWHHQGKVFPGGCDAWSATQVAQKYGPSLGRQPNLFRATYGDDAWRLQAVNRMLAAAIAAGLAA